MPWSRQVQLRASHGRFKIVPPVKTSPTELPVAGGGKLVSHFAGGTGPFRMSIHVPSGLIEDKDMENINQNDVPQLTPMQIEALPERERWLWRNPVALKAVLDGIACAKAGNFVDGPDFEQLAIDLDDDENIDVNDH